MDMFKTFGNSHEASWLGPPKKTNPDDGRRLPLVSSWLCRDSEILSFQVDIYHPKLNMQKILNIRQEKFQHYANSAVAATTASYPYT